MRGLISRKARSPFDCGLEDNNESSRSLLLTELPQNILVPLKYLTKNPPIHEIPPSQEAYQTLTPSIHLFLSRNSLRSLPATLFDLDNITVLSLRNNKLTELPPAIGKLRNLHELNVGGNRLRWLPWEFLELVGRKWDGKLKNLSIFPNPFMDLDDSLPRQREVDLPDFKRPEEENIKDFLLGSEQAVLDQVARQPHLIARSPVTYFSIDGVARNSTMQRSSPSSSQFTRPVQPPEERCRVPSLVELTLRTAIRDPTLPTLPPLLPPDTSNRVFRHLDTAIKVQQSGGMQCTICHRDFVLPRTEWIEWWHCIPGAFFPLVDDDGRLGAIPQLRIPLMRRGCSWRCDDMEP